MELTCNYCKCCTCVDHEGYAKCSQKDNVTVKTSDPACDYLYAALDGSCWRDSFGNVYTFDTNRRGFVPAYSGGTFLTANYIEGLQKISR